MNTVRKIWENGNITHSRPHLAQKTRFDEPLSLHTTFKIGGPADVWVEPETADDLAAIIDFAHGERIPVSVIGGGSNLVVSDAGIRGITVSLACFNTVRRTAEGVQAGAGIMMNDLGAWCASHGLSGIERFAGLPGSVGGAVFMNARCYEISVSDVFLGAECLYFADGRCTITNKEFLPGEWAYKRSPFQGGRSCDPLVVADGTVLVLSAGFRVQPGDPAAITAAMSGWVSDRESRGHFRYPSAGSAFKNNHAFGKPSGKIIDEAGLRGFRIGDAQVAPWHGNFIINAGAASASDVLALVTEIRTRVHAVTGFELEPEILFVGEGFDGLQGIGEN